jgi:hypothetical protein
MDFDHNIVCNDNSWEYGGFGKKMGESIERTLANLKKSLGAKLPNAPMSLESGDVRLTFQFKMLEFVDSMNQDVAHLSKGMPETPRARGGPRSDTRDLWRRW